MLPYLQINSKCIDCDGCRIICPENAIIKVMKDYTISSWACSMCNICVEICPADAIVIKGEPEIKKR